MPSGPWLETYTGRQIWLKEPKPEDIDLEDIAHALSQICRFGGHTRRFYSAAEHSILVSHLCSNRMALTGLMHDAVEAYLVDLPSPVKSLCPDYVALEEAWQRIMAERWQLPLAPIPDEVKDADKMALYHESIDLMAPGMREQWQSVIPAELRHDLRQLHGFEILGLEPMEAEKAFLRRCVNLTR
jgi:hypothetical protein